MMQEYIHNLMLSLLIHFFYSQLLFIYQIIDSFIVIRTKEREKEQWHIKYYVLCSVKEKCVGWERSQSSIEINVINDEESWQEGLLAAAGQWGAEVFD